MSDKIEQRDDVAEVVQEVEVEAEVEAEQEKESGDKDRHEDNPGEYSSDMRAPTPVIVVEDATASGPTSWEELDAMHEAQEKAADLQQVVAQFQIMQQDIFDSDAIEDKGAAMMALSSGLSQRLSSVKERKSKWQPLTDKAVNFVADHKKAEMKTEGGIKFPASDFAFTPDKEKPSTWKLRMSEDRPGNITKSQLGRAAAAFSPGGFRGQKVQIPSGDVAKVKAKIRSEYRKLGVELADIPLAVKEQSSFMVYKEADGTYRWLAVYSNNFRDDDGRPEIISEQSHIDFVKAVDSGEWPYPELWAWHVRGSRWGVSDFVAYDKDTGFALAIGTVDKGKEHVAEAMAARDDLLVSHGMPRSEIRRDDKDLSVLTRHRTAEISPLLKSKAANKHTEFITLSKETDMNISPEKRDFLTQVGINPDEIEAALAAKKQQAEDEGRESKEVKEEVVAEAAAEAPQEPSGVGLTPELIGQALAAALQPVLDRLSALEQKAQAEPEEREADDLANLMASYKSNVIGQPDARVDGRTKEAKDAPKERQGGFTPHAKLNNEGYAATSINRIFSNQLSKELVELQGGSNG